MEEKKEELIVIESTKIVLSIYEKKGTSFYNIIDEFNEKIELAEEILVHKLIRPVVIKTLMKIMRSMK